MSPFPPGQFPIFPSASAPEAIRGIHGSTTIEIRYQNSDFVYI
jgi:hypothetical protein